ncbi:MAG: hypothetical protein E6417_34530, partial [Bradyrhizobium sp.]|nr:hypothetical protein [Bradyrhizobium sp.]
MLRAPRGPDPNGLPSNGKIWPIHGESIIIPRIAPLVGFRNRSSTKPPMIAIDKNVPSPQRCARDIVNEIAQV